MQDISCRLAMQIINESEYINGYNGKYVGASRIFASQGNHESIGEGLAFVNDGYFEPSSLREGAEIDVSRCRHGDENGLPAPGEMPRCLDFNIAELRETHKTPFLSLDTVGKGTPCPNQAIFSPPRH